MKRHEANETRAERLEHSKCLINASWLMQERRETFSHTNTFWNFPPWLVESEALTLALWPPPL